MECPPQQLLASHTFAIMVKASAFHFVAVNQKDVNSLCHVLPPWAFPLCSLNVRIITALGLALIIEMLSQVAVPKFILFAHNVYLDPGQ